MRKLIFVFVASTILLQSCSLPSLLCYLNFKNLNKKYEFVFSKQELKSRIAKVYDKNKRLFLLTSGTINEQNKVNLEIKRYGYDLDKTRWNKFKDSINTSATDTLTVVLIKKLSRNKQIALQLIIEGDNNKSSLVIKELKYSQRDMCRKDTSYYLPKLIKKVENKFIGNLQ
jgi:hypothetical protein